LVTSLTSDRLSRSRDSWTALLAALTELSIWQAVTARRRGRWGVTTRRVRPPVSEITLAKWIHPT
jgi:hypothetical protein